MKKFKYLPRFLLEPVCVSIYIQQPLSKFRDSVLDFLKNCHLKQFKTLNTYTCLPKGKLEGTTTFTRHL